MAFGLSASTIAALVSAVGGAAGAGTGIASAVKAGHQQPPTLPQTTSSADMSKALLPQISANAAARGTGAASPSFYAGLVDQSTGTPGSGLDILGDIRRQIGQSP